MSEENSILTFFTNYINANWTALCDIPFTIVGGRPDVTLKNLYLYDAANDKQESCTSIPYPCSWRFDICYLNECAGEVLYVRSVLGIDLFQLVAGSTSVTLRTCGISYWIEMSFVAGLPPGGVMGTRLDIRLYTPATPDINLGFDVALDSTTTLACTVKIPIFVPVDGAGAQQFSDCQLQYNSLEVNATLNLGNLLSCPSVPYPFTVFSDRACSAGWNAARSFASQKASGAVSNVLQTLFRNNVATIFSSTPPNPFFFDEAEFRDGCPARTFDLTSTPDLALFQAEFYTANANYSLETLSITPLPSKNNSFLYLGLALACVAILLLYVYSGSYFPTVVHNSTSLVDIPGVVTSKN